MHFSLLLCSRFVEGGFRLSLELDSGSSGIGFDLLEVKCWSLLSCGGLRQ